MDRLRSNVNDAEIGIIEQPEIHEISVSRDQTIEGDAITIPII